MQGIDWQDHWGSVARTRGDVRIISGWGDRTFQEVLASITDAAEKLDLSPEHVLLDIGCGGGIFEIAFAHWLREIHGADYARDAVRFTRGLTARYGNVALEVCTLLHLPFRDRSFDRVLANSVIQYLDSPESVEDAARELFRVTKPGGIVLLSLIPDAAKRQDFLDGYRHLDIPPGEREKKMRAAEKVLWFSTKDLAEQLGRIGFSRTRKANPVDPFQKKYYFDLILTR